MSWMSHNIEDIINFLQLSDRLATAGQPTIELYPAIAAAGYQVVINLALTDSPNEIWQTFIETISLTDLNKN
jgi:hypothetical protein